jgi:hypothetical protein
MSHRTLKGQVWDYWFGSTVGECWRCRTKITKNKFHITQVRWDYDTHIAFRPVCNQCAPQLKNVHLFDAICELAIESKISYAPTVPSRHIRDVYFETWASRWEHYRSIRRDGMDPMEIDIC